MKKFGLMALVFMIITLEGHAQTVNDKPIADIDIKYIEIEGTPRTMSKK